MGEAKETVTRKTSGFEKRTRPSFSIQHKKKMKKEIMIMGKKLRKENDVSAFGESQTPFTFPTVSSNQKENEKKVPSDKINLRHFPI